MNLSEIIELNSSDKWHRHAKQFIEFHKLENVVVSSDVHELIANFQNQVIAETFFKTVFQEILSLENNFLHDCLHGVLLFMSLDLIDQHKEDMKFLVESLESQVNKGQDFVLDQEFTPKKYEGLLNVFNFMTNHFKLRRNYHWDFPNATNQNFDVINFELPFALNMLRLYKIFPERYNDQDLSKPFYPLHLKIITKNRLPVIKGIKNSDHYYPIKRIYKILKGDKGDNTVLAIRDKKFYYLRCSNSCLIEGVIASKLARLVDKTFFASESLLSNRIVASRKLSKYKNSLADKNVYDQLKKIISEKSHLLNEIGKLDEILNILFELDKNIENIGVSSDDPFLAGLSKIDFENCALKYSMPKDLYERNIVSKALHQTHATFFNDQSSYVNEKLTVRLKCSLLSKELIEAIVDKVYVEDNKEKEDVVKELSVRVNLALELFSSHPKAQDFLNQSKNILTQLFNEIDLYIKAHFDKDTYTVLVNSLGKRLATIKDHFNSKSLIFDYEDVCLSPKHKKSKSLELRILHPIP